MTKIYVWLADDPVPDQKPKAPNTDVSSALNTLISWSMWTALMLCALAFIVGAGMAALGANAARPDMAERGKRAAIWALVGAALVGLGVVLVNSFYNIGG